MAELPRLELHTKHMIFAPFAMNSRSFDHYQIVLHAVSIDNCGLEHVTMMNMILGLNQLMRPSWRILISFPAIGHDTFWVFIRIFPSRRKTNCMKNIVGYVRDSI